MLSEALMAASLLIAAYQDLKRREVEDRVWIPAAIGIALALIFGNQLFFTLVKLGFVALIVVVATWYGTLGQADLIAFVVVGADPAPLSLTLTLGAAAVALAAHIGYLYRKGQIGRSLEIPVSQFEKEWKWIPKAVISAGVRTEVGRDVNEAREEALAKAVEGSTVEVKYGVPTVAYLGLGYFAFLVYALISNFQFFLTFP
ncbi:MAG: prepilin peptidase [Thaumarchaeota archaeon]|nr:MAG: prepilin peptidase [Nitrososphaerota archaeon]